MTGDTARWGGWKSCAREDQGKMACLLFTALPKQTRFANKKNKKTEAFLGVCVCVFFFSVSGRSSETETQIEYIKKARNVRIDNT